MMKSANILKKKVLCIQFVIFVLSDFAVYSSADVLIFLDIFPTSSLNSSNWTRTTSEPTVDDVGISEPTEPYSLRLNGDPDGGDGVESQVMNLSLYESAQLKYWYEQGGGGESPDSGEDLIVEYWDGSTWLELERQFGSTTYMSSYVQPVINLPVEALHAGFRIRFRSIGTSGPYDDWFVDNIEIRGVLAGDLSITPMTGLVSSGLRGGPFSPESISYTLENLGPDSIDWTASVTQDWLDVSITGGTLEPNDVNNVQISINSNAMELDYGTYNETVTFTNLNSGIIKVRPVQLKIQLPEYKLIASDGAGGDLFGYSVDMSGNRCIVGAYGDDDNGSSSGSAYIFEWNGSNWTEKAKLTASDGVDSDYFGYSVSISGDRCIIGAYGDDDNGSSSGSAYIFEWNGTGWTETAKLTASDGYSSDYFGISVDISGDRCIVGAYGDDDNGSSSGSAYIFEWNGLGWIETAKLTAPDGYSSDNFGISVDISGDRCIVGAPYDDDKGSSSGSAYIFQRDGSSWIETTKLTASDGYTSDYFGYSVGINGDHCIASAYYDDDNGSDSGSAYIFQRNGSSWTETKLTASDGYTSDYFGYSVEISGDRYIIGACGDDDNGSDSGSAYVSGQGDNILITASEVPEDFIISGYQTGPFTPSIKTYELSNIRPNSVDWSADFSESWLDINPASGTLNPGDTNLITVRLTDDVNTFAVGQYNDVIVFKNKSNGNRQKRYVSLVVKRVPVGINVIDSIEPFNDKDMPFGYVIAGSSRVEHITLENTDTVFDLLISDINVGGYYYLDANDRGVQREGQAGNFIPQVLSDGFHLENMPNLPVLVPPLGSFTFDVNFSPVYTIGYQSEVIIIYNEQDDINMAKVRLHGSGVPDYLEVLPEDEREFRGHPGGPFVPTEQPFELNNIGQVSIYWTVSGPNWLDITPAGGNLNVGDSVDMYVSTNSNADILPEGTYDANLVFHNSITGITQYRKIILNVCTDPKIWTNPDIYEIFVRQKKECIRKLTIGNAGGTELEYSLAGTSLNYTMMQQETDGPVILELDEEYVSSLQQYEFSISDELPYVKGELLVRFAPIDSGALPTANMKNAILSRSLGAAQKREFKTVPGLSLIELPEGVSVAEAMEALKNDNSVIYAQPNYEYYALETIPDDTLFDELWGMHNTGQNGGLPGADISAPEAWDISTGTGSIVVAVIDTGVDYTHPDLGDNMWINEPEFYGTSGYDDDGNGYIDDIYGYDFVNNDGDPMDDSYHGTHCSGTIGAVGDNGVGVVGVCWSLKIMAVKFLPSGGPGNSADAVSSIQYAMDMGARVISISWGGSSYDQALKDVIDAAGDAGIVFVAAAGNDDLNTDTYPIYPSSYDCQNIISVMATDRSDNRASFSNYGPVSVDIGAPGVEILSCEPGSGYRYLQGTSTATPHVAGACALLLSKNPGLGYEEVKERLMQNVDKTLSGLCVSGGRMNLFKSIEEVGPASWLSFEPDSGVIAAQSSQDVNVMFDTNQPVGIYEGMITVFSNDPFEPELDIPIRINLEPYDYFTELFEPNDPWDPNDPFANDLDNTSILFKPDGMGYYRTVCRQTATEFPENPDGSVPVSLDDDDYAMVDLNGVTVSLYGEEYDRFYIGSNGYISFISGDTSYFETLEQHFLLPRISALFVDLSPSEGGEVSYKILPNKVVVTFENVSEFNTSNSNSFQVEMWFDGKIRMTWLNIDCRTGLVGLSEGIGLYEFFANSDFSEYDLCCFMGDLNDDLEVNFRDYGILTGCWNRFLVGPGNVAHWKFDEDSGSTAVDSSGNGNDGLLESGMSFVTGKMGNAIEFDGLDDRISAGYFDVNGGDGHLTIVAWIKADDFDKPDARIVSKTTGHRNQNHYWMLSTVQSGGIKLGFRLKTNGFTSALVADSGDLQPGVWTHVAATWDGSMMRLFKDGDVVGSRFKGGTISMNDTVPVAIGNQPFGVFGGDKPFDGLIDDLRIYNFALSQSEIQELMNNNPEDRCVECDFCRDGLIDTGDLEILIENWLK